MMTCKQARELAQQAMDGTLEDRAGLEAHVSQCEVCAAEMARMERLGGELRALMATEVDEAWLERVTLGAMAAARVEMRRGNGWVTAAAVVTALVVGALVGRAAWPKERIVERVIERPKIVERIVTETVEVPVEVVREVIVEKPVIRTRIVYRERIVEVEKPMEPAPRVELEETVVHVASQKFGPRPIVSTELHPVTFMEDGEVREGAVEGDGEGMARAGNHEIAKVTKDGPVRGDGHGA